MRRAMVVVCDAMRCMRLLFKKMLIASCVCAARLRRLMKRIRIVVGGAAAADTLRYLFYIPYIIFFFLQRKTIFFAHRCFASELIMREKNTKKLLIVCERLYILY